MEYISGNEIVDRLSTMNFSGNIISPNWFKTVLNDKGKPYLLAILILSEIVYWYRPVEVRDEETGEFIGYRTKFKNDLLQKSYQNLAEYYHVSKRQVTAAIVALEKIGVIKRVFREVRKDGKLYNNVLFIQLHPDKLQELTYPQRVEPKTNKDVENADVTSKGTKHTPLPQKNVTGCHKKMGEPPTKKCDTNTKNTKENTNYILNPLLSAYETDCRKCFLEQIGYDVIKADYKDDNAANAVLEECIEVAVDVLKSKKRKILVNSEWQSVAFVQQKLLSLNAKHMKFVVQQFLDAKTEVKKIRSYLLTCMVNAVYGLEIKDAKKCITKKTKNNAFINFPQRERNKEQMDSLEKQLLSRQEV